MNEQLNNRTNTTAQLSLGRHNPLPCTHESPELCAEGKGYPEVPYAVTAFTQHRGNDKIAEREN